MKNITKDNIDFKERQIRLNNENEKEDSMRYMVWFALSSMLVYPSLLLICDIFHLNNAITQLASIAEIYFISVSGLISVYFGSNAYSKTKSKPYSSHTSSSSSSHRILYDSNEEDSEI